MGGTPFIPGAGSPFLVAGHLLSAAWLRDTASNAPRRIAPDHSEMRFILFMASILSAGSLSAISSRNCCGLRARDALVPGRYGSACPGARIGLMTLRGPSRRRAEHHPVQIRPIPQDRDSRGPEE